MPTEEAIAAHDWSHVCEMWLGKVMLKRVDSLESEGIRGRKWLLTVDGMEIELASDSPIRIVRIDSDICSESD